MDTASWYEIWEGARAVAGMCTRRGLSGISTGHGRLQSWDSVDIRVDCADECVVGQVFWAIYSSWSRLGLTLRSCLV